MRGGGVSMVDGSGGGGSGGSSVSSSNGLGGSVVRLW